MKRFLIFTMALASISTISFSQRESMTPGSKSILGLIDATVKYAIENKAEFTNLAQMTFIASARAGELGFTVDPNFQRYEFSTYSSQFKEKLQLLNQSGNYDSKEQYIAAIEDAIADVGRSPMNTNEKNVLLFNFSLMIGILNYGEEIFQSNPYSFRNNFQPELNTNYATGSCRYLPERLSSIDFCFADYYISWWRKWGKCLAGILGGAVSGGVTTGMIGAAIGTATVPVVGTVSLGVVGAIGGAIGGGLTGAATYCFRNFPFPRILTL